MPSDGESAAGPSGLRRSSTVGPVGNRRGSRRGSTMAGAMSQSTPNLAMGEAAGNPSMWMRRGSRRASIVTPTASEPLNRRLSNSPTGSASPPASAPPSTAVLDSTGANRRGSVMSAPNSKVHFQSAGLAVMMVRRVAPGSSDTVGGGLTAELVKEVEARADLIDPLVEREEMSLVFTYYCMIAAKGRFTSMPLAGYTRMLRDCRLYDASLPQVGIEMFFKKLLKLLGSEDDGLTLRQFCASLVVIAAVKRLRGAGRGPSTARTAASGAPTSRSVLAEGDEGEAEGPATTRPSSPAEGDEEAPAGPPSPGTDPDGGSGPEGGEASRAQAGPATARPLEPLEEVVRQVVEGHVLKHGKREKLLDPIKQQMSDPKVEGLFRHSAEHVARLFTFYAMQDKRAAKRPADAAAGKAAAKIKRQWSQDIFITFARQFGIFPGFASLSELTRIFRSTNDDDDVNVDVSEFKEILCRVAMLMFPIAPPEDAPSPDTQRREGAGPEPPESLFDQLYSFFEYCQTPYKRYTFQEWRLPPKHAAVEDDEDWDGGVKPLEDEYWHIKWVNVAKLCPEGATPDMAIPRLIEEILSPPPVASAAIANALHGCADLVHAGQPLAAAAMIERTRDAWELMLLEKGGAKRAAPDAILKSFARRASLTKNTRGELMQSALPLAGQVYLLQAQAQAFTAADDFERGYEVLQIARLIGIKSSPDWRRDTQLATTFAMMGSVAFHRGLFEDASVEFEQALQIREEGYGRRHVQTAAIENNLGACELMQGRIVQALDFFTRAHKALSALHAPENPRTRIALWNCTMAKGLRLQLTPVFHPPPTREQVAEAAARAAKLRSKRKALGQSASQGTLSLATRT